MVTTRTTSAFNATRKNLENMQQPTREAEAEKSLDRVLSGISYGWSRGGALSHFTSLRAHAACTSVADIENIDWSMWRLGIEYADLNRRVEARGKSIEKYQAAPSVSHYLHCAIGHALFGARPVAIEVLTELAFSLVEALNRIQLGSKVPVQAGAIGFAYRDILGQVPDHSALTIPEDLLTPAGLARAAMARKTYANPKNEGGSLLSSPHGDLIPLELILLNNKLPEGQQDPVLSEFANKIAETSYPSDPVFQAMDTKISVEGW